MIYIIKTQDGPVYSSIPVYHDFNNREYKTDAEESWISPNTRQIYRYSASDYNPETDREVFLFGDQFIKR